MVPVARRPSARRRDGSWLRWSRRELTSDRHHDEHGGGAQDGEQRAQAPAAQRRARPRPARLRCERRARRRGAPAWSAWDRCSCSLWFSAGTRESSARHPWWRTARQAGVSSRRTAPESRSGWAAAPWGETGAAATPVSAERGAILRMSAAETAAEPKSCGISEILRRVQAARPKRPPAGASGGRPRTRRGSPWCCRRPSGRRAWPAACRP